jgi:hypothetical protein
MKISRTNTYLAIDKWVSREEGGRKERSCAQTN